MKIDDGPFQSMSDGLAFVRIENVNHDDEEAAKAFEILQNARRERNTIYMSEFQQYEPIFRLSGREEIGNDRYDELCSEWMVKFSAYDPVYIRDDDTHETVMVIPPMFQRINPINVVREGTDIATAFANACKLPDEFDQKKTYWGEYFNKAMQLANTNKSLAPGRQQAKKMTDQLKRQGVIRDPSNKQPASVHVRDDAPAKEQLHTDIGDADVEPL